jgi:dTMP kinase
VSSNDGGAVNLGESPKGTGVFITFEGCEGCGKTEQSKQLYAWLNEEFPEINVVRTREPGGSHGAEQIRSLLLTGEVSSWLPQSELLLFYAARYDHWVHTILPVLEKGGIVVCDRFFDSSNAYQGWGHGLPEKYFVWLDQLLNDENSGHPCVPDITYVLCIDPAVGLKRSQARLQAGRSLGNETEDRFERIDVDFHKRVQAGYEHILKNNPDRCVRVDASRSIEEIHRDIVEDVKKKVSRQGYKPSHKKS